MTVVGCIGLRNGARDVCQRVGAGCGVGVRKDPAERVAMQPPGGREPGCGRDEQGGESDGVGLRADAIHEQGRIVAQGAPAVMKKALEAADGLAVLDFQEALNLRNAGVSKPILMLEGFFDVEDLALAHVKAVEYLEAGGETTHINLGTSRGSSVWEIVKAAEQVIGAPVMAASVLS